MKLFNKEEKPTSEIKWESYLDGTSLLSVLQQSANGIEGLVVELETEVSQHSYEKQQLPSALATALAQRVQNSVALYAKADDKQVLLAKLGPFSPADPKVESLKYWEQTLQGAPEAALATYITILAKYVHALAENLQKATGAKA